MQDPSTDNPCVPITDFERQEMLDLKDKVYFVPNLPTRNLPTIDDPACNFGFDDARGRYLIIPGDHIAYRYEIVGLLRQETNGVVVKALDHRENKRQVAIKVVDFLGEENTQLSELEAHVITYLHSTAKTRGLSGPNIVKLDAAYLFRSHLCLAMELVEGQNLYEQLLHLHKSGMPSPLIRHITREVVQALVLLDSADIVHGDMILENIHFNPSTQSVQIIDFGNSFFDLPENDNSWRTVARLCCRPPEAVLGAGIGRAVDMWGLGCMVAEMFTGWTLFSASDEDELLMLQQAFLGAMPKDMTLGGTRCKQFFNVDGSQMHPRASRCRPGSSSLQEVLSAAPHELDADLLSFVMKCLALDPSQRMTPAEALKQPFLTHIDVAPSDKRTPPRMPILYFEPDSPELKDDKKPSKELIVRELQGFARLPLPSTASQFSEGVVLSSRPSVASILSSKSSVFEISFKIYDKPEGANVPPEAIPHQTEQRLNLNKPPAVPSPLSNRRTVPCATAIIEEGVHDGHEIAAGYRHQDDAKPSLCVTSVVPSLFACNSNEIDCFHGPNELKETLVQPLKSSWL